jgi:hypothetical protein
MTRKGVLFGKEQVALDHSYMHHDMETVFVNNWERKMKIFMCATKRHSMGKETEESPEHCA